MIIGEATCLVPNIQIPHSQWDLSESDAATPFPFPINFNANAVSGDYSPSFDSSNSRLRFLSIDLTPNEELDLDTLPHDFDMPIDTFSGDHFRMFEFKVRKCTRVRSHDWTECPYAHPAEKARRRDPRKYHYSGTACPDFRNGNCKKGDSCEFAHGVFECWLHPARYRTQLCKDGTNCRRRVCFFAHTPDQLRVLTDGSGESSSNGSPIRHAFDPSATFVSSPTSVLNSSQISSLSDSPPTSPLDSLNGGVSFNTVSMNEIVSLMGNVQLDNRVPSTSTRVSHVGSVFGSPRGSIIRPGFLSVPSTPTRAEPKSGWDRRHEEEPVMERVESGRDLRARIYAKLSRENSFGGSEKRLSDSAPDIGWVSELVK